MSISKKYPNLSEEKKLWKKGYRYVVGLDEAGRGPLAGPVVAAAVVIKNPKHEIRNSKQIPDLKPQYSKQFGSWKIGTFEIVSNFDIQISNLKLRDSKKLSQKQRQEFYKLITENSLIEWGIGKVSEKAIDKINILEATKLAMIKAVSQLEKKLRKQSSCDFHGRGNCTIGKFLVLDGKMKLDLPPPQTRTWRLWRQKCRRQSSLWCGGEPIPQKAIVKADEKVFSCAVASIMAKVKRDTIMLRYHKKYPEYRFDLHKGYPTKLHLEMLKKYGLCKIHRKSFRPVLEILKIKDKK